MINFDKANHLVKTSKWSFHTTSLRCQEHPYQAFWLKVMMDIARANGVVCFGFDELPLRQALSADLR